jgi:hypothetical protein
MPLYHHLAVRAIVTAITAEAPALFSSLAHSSIVLPVVITSSSKRILFPETLTGLLTEKAPLTFTLRSAAESSI